MENERGFWQGMNKILVIGLDGATWDVIKPLADEGKLPAVGELMESGVWGELESTIPLITVPVWFSRDMGVNPDRIGVFNS